MPAKCPATKLRVGLVDLDTSHPDAWVPLLHSMGHVVCGVYDSGSVHPPGYAKQFAKRHGIVRVYDDVEQLAEDCDMAMICGCDWDKHCDQAEPFVRRQKPVFIDKPIAGSVDDLKRFIHWSDAGARISGGSALRFCREVERYLARPLDERGIPQTVVVTCGWDAFNYGIHAYALLTSLMGDQVSSVQHLSRSSQLRVKVDFDDGRSGLIVIGATGQPLPFVATVVTPIAVETLRIDNQHLYRQALKKTMPYLEGQTERAPISIRSLVVPELCAIAALQSEASGAVVELGAGSSQTTVRYDGLAFARMYRQAKYPAPTPGTEQTAAAL